MAYSSVSQALLLRKPWQIVWVDGVVSFFIYLLNGYLLGGYCVPGMELGATRVGEQDLLAKH